MALNSEYWPDGFGETTGDSLVTTGPWYMSGGVLYVDSVTGDDSNSGLERNQPLATLVHAVSEVDPNGVIILSAAHDESMVTSLVVSIAGVTIVGAGASGSEPTATLRANSASGGVIALSGVRNELRNIKFATAAQFNSGRRLSIGSGATPSSHAIIKGCRFEMSVLDTGPAASLFVGSSPTFDGCTFVVTGTDATAGEGLIVEGSTWANLVVEDCVFDGGTGGFVGGVGFDASGSTMSAFRFENVSLLRGADATFTAASQGRINPVTTTGGARVVFS